MKIMRPTLTQPASSTYETYEPSNNQLTDKIPYIIQKVASTFEHDGQIQQSFAPTNQWAIASFLILNIIHWLKTKSKTHNFVALSCGQGHKA